MIRQFYLFASLLLLPFFAKAQALTDTTAQLQQWYNDANQLIENYQFDKALEPLTNCYHYASYRVDYLLKIAYCHQQLGRYQDAKIYYNEVLKQDSTHVRALIAHADIATREANYARAQIYYEALIRLDSTNSYYYKQAAYTALRRNAVIPAVRQFLEARRLNPEDLEVIDQLADIYIALDDLASAENVVEKGLHQDQKNIKLLRNKARIHQKKQENEAVVETVNRIMEQGDTTDYYQMILGVAYLKLDSLDQGIFHLTQIEKREKADDRIFHYLGLAYFEKEELEKAREYFELAIEAGISQKMYAYHGDLALLFDKQHQLRPAIQHYKQSLEYRNNNEYLFHLAHASDRYYKDKRIAFDLYQQYLKTNDNKNRTFTSERLEQLKEHLHFQSN